MQFLSKRVLHFYFCNNFCYVKKRKEFFRIKFNLLSIKGNSFLNNSIKKETIYHLRKLKVYLNSSLKESNKVSIS